MKSDDNDPAFDELIELMKCRRFNPTWIQRFCETCMNQDLDCKRCNLTIIQKYIGRIKRRRKA